jgi:hypothetical protein
MALADVDGNRLSKSLGLTAERSRSFACEKVVDRISFELKVGHVNGVAIFRVTIL